MTRQSDSVSDRRPVPVSHDALSRNLSDRSKFERPAPARMFRGGASFMRPVLSLKTMFDCLFTALDKVITYLLVKKNGVVTVVEVPQCEITAFIFSLVL